MRVLNSRPEHEMAVIRDEIRQRDAQSLKSGDGGGTFDGMEQRVLNLENAVNAIRASQDRMELRMNSALEHLVDLKATQTRTDDRTGRIEVSQGRIEERMGRVMDRTANMPSEEGVNKMLNHKLTILGVVVAAVVAFMTFAQAS